MAESERKGTKRHEEYKATEGTKRDRRALKEGKVIKTEGTYRDVCHRQKKGHTET